MLQVGSLAVMTIAQVIVMIGCWLYLSSAHNLSSVTLKQFRVGASATYSGSGFHKLVAPLLGYDNNRFGRFQDNVNQ